MRPKFVATVLSLTALFLSAVWWLKRGPEAPTTPPLADETAGPMISSSADSTPRETGVPAPVIASELTPEQQRATTEAEIEHLTELSMKNDPGSLAEILSALTHSNREVREAAIEATIQVADFNAIPTLKQASELVDDPEEKIAFREAIEFLSVPPLAFNGNSVLSKTPEQIAAAESRRALRRAEREHENAGPRSRNSPRSFPAAAAAE